MFELFSFHEPIQKVNKNDFLWIWSVHWISYYKFKVTLCKIVKVNYKNVWTHNNNNSKCSISHRTWKIAWICGQIKKRERKNIWNILLVLAQRKGKSILFPDQ